MNVARPPRDPRRACPGVSRRLAAGLLALLLAACGGESGAADGTRAMAARLAAITTSPDRAQDTYLNDRRAAEYRSRLDAGGLAPQEEIETRAMLANELLVAGETREALDVLADLDARLQAADLPKPVFRQLEVRVRELVALAWLRLGEEENCILHHGTESCLLPIRGDGVHRLTEGSENAIREFGWLLDKRPKHVEAAWLLNIAAMTLGAWPDGVPADRLIPPEVFEAEDDVGRFPDVAGERGVDVDALCGGVCLEDFDLDGDLDLLVSSWDLADQVRYFVNDGAGRFTEATEASGLLGITGGLNMVHADYDNDGLPDVLVLRGAWRKEAGRVPNSLLRNLGGGRFEDVTEAAGLLSEHPTQTAAWLDYDGDGWLDLFIGNESSPGGTAHPCELYHNDGGTFTEVARHTGAAVVGYVKGVAAGDYDDDGLPDLYVSRNDGANLLLHNDGPADGRPRPAHDDPPSRREAAPPRPWRFTDVAPEAGVTEPAWSFPTWWFDHDNDGDLDLWVSGYRFNSVRQVVKDYLGEPHQGELPRLHENLGGGRFRDATADARLDRMLMTMGCNFGDLDNDGWPDFYVGTGEPDFRALYPNRMFVNRPGPDGRRVYREVTTSGGFGHLQKGHGIAFGDVDGDGDQDVYAVMGGAFQGDAYRNALFLNPGQGRRALVLRLEGVAANRSAIGARVRVRVTTADGGSRDVFTTVGTGGSFGSASLQAEVGLGDAVAVEEVEVRWPGSGRVQTVTALAPGGVYALREGDDPVEVGAP